MPVVEIDGGSKAAAEPVLRADVLLAPARNGHRAEHKNGHQPSGDGRENHQLLHSRLPLD